MHKRVHTIKIDATTSGTQVIPVDAGDYGSARVQLNVTSLTGTSPTLTVLLEDSLDLGATWNTIITMAQATGATRQVKNTGGSAEFSNDLRISYTFGGTVTASSFEVDVVLKEH